MSYLKDQRARDLARKGARLWSAAAGGRSGLVAPIGSGTRQGGGGRPSLDRQNITANDPAQDAIVFPEPTGPQPVSGPPSDPAPPEVVAGNPLRIQVTHNLGSDGGVGFDLEEDLDHLEVHVGETSGFTVTNATLVGTLTANAGMLAVEVPAIGSFDAPGAQRWVKVVAVDFEGERSGASTAVSVTADLITEQFIESLSADKITAGTIDANDVTIANLTVSTAQVTGNFSAARITTGTLDATDVTVAAGGTVIDSSGITIDPGFGESSKISLGSDASITSDGVGIAIGGAVEFGQRPSTGTVFDGVQSIATLADIPSGNRWANEIDWTATGTNGSSSIPVDGSTGDFLESGDSLVGHRHQVPYHTHRIYI